MNKQVGKKFKVTLVRSPIGINPKHKAGIKTLGLRRINHSVIVNDHPCTIGIVNKINYLISVEEV